ncbi:hypothetical protein ACLB2K_070861 [Fragaria x ananassa]
MRVEHFTIFGYARSKMTDAELRTTVSKMLADLTRAAPWHVKVGQGESKWSLGGLRQIMAGHGRPLASQGCPLAALGGSRLPLSGSRRSLRGF